MRNVKGSHEFAELKALYAQEHGCALRTAQLHAKLGHADWTAFLARNAGRALKAGQPTVAQATALVARADGLTVEMGDATVKVVVAPTAAIKPAHLRTVEEYAECETWEAYVQSSEQMRLQLANGNAMNAVGFVKIAGDALKSYHVARAKRVSADIEAGRLKPVSAWHSVKSALAKIAALVSGVEEVAAAANPDNPIVARRALTIWKHDRFVPAVEQLIREAEATLAMAAA